MGSLYTYSLVVLISFYTNYSFGQEGQNLDLLSYEDLSELIISYDRQGNYKLAIDVTNYTIDKELNDTGKIDTFYIIEHTNNLGYFYARLGDNIKAKQTFQKTQKFWKKAVGKHTFNYINASNNLGTILVRLNEYNYAESVLIDAKKMWEASSKGTDTAVYASVLNNLADLYMRLGEYDFVEDMYFEVINIREKIYGKSHYKYANAINNLAGLYRIQGRFREQEKLCIESEKILKNTFGEKHVDYVNIVGNLGVLYQNLGDYETAEFYHLKALKIRKEISPHSYHEAVHKLATLYLLMNKFNEAEKLLKSVIKQKNLNKEALCRYTNSLGVLYGKLGQHGKALSLYKSVLSQRKELYGDYHPSSANTLNSSAHAYYLQEQLDSAALHCFLALKANSNNFATIFPEKIKKDGSVYDSKLTSISELQLLSKIDFKNDLYANESIYLLIKILEKQKNTDPVSTFEKRFLLSSLGINRNINIQNNFAENKDKAWLLAEQNVFAQFGIETILNLGKDKNLAYPFFEANKSNIMMSSLQLRKLPDSLAVIEKELWARQKLNEQKIAKAQEKNLDNTLLVSNQNIINKEINSFQSKIKAHYPKYHKLRYEYKVENLENIQAQLSNESAILEYLVTDSCFYLIAITNKNIFLHKIDERKEKLNAKIKLLRTALTKESDNYQNFSQITKTSYWLYQRLIEPIQDNLGKSINELIIIPDGEMGNLPFEILLVEPTSPEFNANQYFYHLEALHYLLEDYAISYDYSSTLWYEHTQKKVLENNKILAFAPKYSPIETSVRGKYRNISRRDTLVNLPYAIHEVEMLDSLFMGTFFLEGAATKYNFEQNYQNHGIVHLAMHGLFSPHDPLLSSLAFFQNDTIEKSNLDAREVLQLDLNNNLVVLSACQTGYGNYEAGEGTMSLARHFMYAGTPSIIVSLWDARDKSTSIIVQSFYENLAKGMPKNQALRNAKLDYLRNAKDKDQRHPNTWAHLIQIGNTQNIPVSIKEGSFWKNRWFIGIALLFTLCGAIYYFRFSR